MKKRWITYFKKIFFYILIIRMSLYFYVIFHIIKIVIFTFDYLPFSI